ncbi:MAG TPA: cyclic nucleotide-binding domain-containing protein, partial [Planctomycetaceae bacterium]|nr:cyclic nucleotide-binding domain-containing protein [Planctomycetaceae bacterium]
MNHAASDASLAQCALFRAMQPSERQQLLALMDSVDYGAGETILREGKSTQSLWVIVDGQCQVVKHTKHGIEQVLARLEICSAFGEMSFFNPAPHSASVKSVTPVKLLCLPREKYDTLLQAGSTAGQKLAINTIA